MSVRNDVTKALDAHELLTAMKHPTDAAPRSTIGVYATLAAKTLRGTKQYFDTVSVVAFIGDAASAEIEEMVAEAADLMIGLINDLGYVQVTSVNREEDQNPYELIRAAETRKQSNYGLLL